MHAHYHVTKVPLATNPSKQTRGRERERASPNIFIIPSPPSFRRNNGRQADCDHTTLLRSLEAAASLSPPAPPPHLVPGILPYMCIIQIRSILPCNSLFYSLKKQARNALIPDGGGTKNSAEKNSSFLLLLFFYFSLSIQPLVE